MGKTTQPMGTGDERRDGMSPARTTHARARALRRVALGVAAVSATLAAHAVSGYPLEITAVAPLIWGAVLGLVAVPVPSATRYRSRSAVLTVAILITLQAVVHVVGHVAPWSLGLSPHAHRQAVTWTAVVAHLLGALVLGALIHRGDRWLARLASAVRVLITDVRCRPVAPVWWRVRLVAVPCRVAVRRSDPRGARGPPLHD